MDRGAFSAWLERYFAAARSNDPADVEALFAEDVAYSYGPFAGSADGRAAVVRRWVEGGVPRGLETWFEVLTVDGERGVANWRMSFDEDGVPVTLDGILVCDFDERGRCISHREWFERHEGP